MIQVSFQTEPAGRYPAVALEIACHSEQQLKKFLPRIDRKEFDVSREENKVYLWDRQIVPRRRYLA